MMTLYSSRIMAESLTKSPLFSHLNSADLVVLTKFARRKHANIKDVICRKASPGNQMWVIISGRVKLSSPCIEGREAILGILESGDVFGEMSLLDGQHRSATVIALEPTDLIIIERCNFIPFLEKHPNVALKLMAMMSLRLRLTDECFEDALLHQLPSRLAKKLLQLAKRYGVESREGILISIRLSQRDIGNLVGRSRESINKQMRAWEDQGWISCKGGYITIQNLPALKALTNTSVSQARSKTNQHQGRLMYNEIN